MIGVGSLVVLESAIPTRTLRLTLLACRVAEHAGLEVTEGDVEQAAPQLRTLDIALAGAEIEPPGGPLAAAMVEYLTARSIGEPVRGLSAACECFRVGNGSLRRLLAVADAHGFGPTRAPCQGGSTVWWPSEAVAKAWFEVACLIDAVWGLPPAGDVEDDHDEG